tara:strand:+ start:50 stop:361 length:312 start_codon:yes stop_codon:yes gene_type:complete
MSNIPDWYLIQAQDYISMLQNTEMYTHEELPSITKKQRHFEYQLMREKNGLSRVETARKETKSMNVVMPLPRPQLSISYSQLMSMGYGTMESQKTKRKVNSYA